jgi:anti-anti-sigma factor
MNVLIDERQRSVKPLDRIDANSSSDLDAALLTFTEYDQAIIIDLSECPYLSSAGIRILLKAKKKLQQNHAELFLTSVSPEVFQVLETAGLHNLFCVVSNLEAALQHIQSNQKSKIQICEFVVDEQHFVYQSSGETCKGHFWNTPEVVSYHELGFSIGFGALADSNITASGQNDFFVTAGNCSGFLSDRDQEIDFRIISDPIRAGIPVQEAISFNSHAAGLLKLKEPEKMSFVQLKASVIKLQKEIFSESSVILLLVISFEADNPSISLLAFENAALTKIFSETGLNRFNRLISDNIQDSKAFGLKFSLAEMNSFSASNSLIVNIGQQLTFENILAVEPIVQKAVFENPYIYLFVSEDITDGKKDRLPIETKAGFVLESHKAFLARQLFSDSGSLFVEPLHGGYSAQTFRVTSFDKEGRRLRPTVMKIAHRDLISRESERCKQYALPYIFNNSAIVLGAEFFGETGALRYNFVGIGGESSQLKWLTHLYHESNLESLEPLFDKIFLQILKPWHGQPVMSKIALYKDHDPTFTFFPHIYQTVSELFSISSDDQYVYVPEMERDMLNPYWFLKHEYALRRESLIDYYTGICHGDLNMQNILLDENMNVYLIDFSETKPRSVISDYARLEAIFLIDNAPVENDTEMHDYLQFIKAFYKTESLADLPEITYKGKHSEKVHKNSGLTLKMRQYAFESTMKNPMLLPYYVALLEWTLPIVCYGLPDYQKRISMIVASLLCEQILDERL